MKLQDLIEGTMNGAYIACPNHEYMLHITDVTNAAQLTTKLHQSLPPFEYNLLLEFPGVTITDTIPDDNTLPVKESIMKELIRKIKDWYNQQEYTMSGNFGMQNDSNHQDA